MDLSSKPAIGAQAMSDSSPMMGMSSDEVPITSMVIHRSSLPKSGALTLIIGFHRDESENVRKDHCQHMLIVSMDITYTVEDGSLAVHPSGGCFNLGSLDLLSPSIPPSLEETNSLN